MKPEINFKKKIIQYDMNYHKNKFGNWIKDKNLYRLRSEYAKRNYLWFIKSSDKVLEFGCGVGQNISWRKDSYGYDINKELYPLLKKKGIIMYNKGEDIPDNFFDVVITCMVLEHLEKPIETVKFLREKLKPNGKLITVLPSMTYTSSYGMNESNDGHLFGWTFYEINYLLNYCGFKNVVNKRIYRYGIERLKFLSDRFYFPILSFMGKLFNYFDILIVSKKENGN